MKPTIILIAVLVSLLQVEARPALFNRPGGFFGLFGGRLTDVDLTEAGADVVNDGSAEDAISDRVDKIKDSASSAAEKIQAVVEEQLDIVEATQGIAGKVAEAIDDIVETVAPVTLWGRIVGFFTGWMKPTAKDINDAVSQNIESAAASLSSVGTGLATVESTGLLKPSVTANA